MNRVLPMILVLAAAIGAGGVIAWSRADLPTHQNLRIRGLDFLRTLGFALPSRDIQHMRERSGLDDLANVNCRNCHGESLQSLAWSQPRERHASPAWLAVSPQGSRLYVTLPDLDEVLEVDLASLRISRRARVAGAPTGLALDPVHEALWVACRGGDRLCRVDLASFSEVESAYVGTGPVGVAYAETPDGGRLVIANALSDDISVLSARPLKELVRLAAGREPYGVCISPDGSRGYVANRIAGMPAMDRPPSSELTVIDLAHRRVVGRARLESAHLSEAAVAVPGRAWVLAPVVRVRNLLPITQVARGWVMSGGLALTDPAGSTVLQVPTDEANRFFADPGGLVVSPDGRRAYLASAGSDVVSVIDLDRLAGWLIQADEETRRAAIHDLELAADYVVARIPTGRNPRQLALAPDGSRLFVAEYLDDAILIINTASLAAEGRVALGSRRAPDAIRRGERLFTWAGQTFQGQFSCRSCHPDGHVDGLNYDFDGDGVGDNLLDNRSLQGLAGTWPYKWNGRNPSLKVQCGARFAKVLMRTDPFDGPQLDDLTRFVESMPPARTRHVLDTKWTEGRERGRRIFFATETPAGRPIPVERRCATCHRPPLYTNRLKTSVGTRGLRDPTDAFDTPHLLGVAASAPYLHDGRARSLEELWTLYQTNDLHGVTSYMTKQQLNDLVEFLKTL